MRPKAHQVIGHQRWTVDHRLAVGLSSGDEWDVSSRPKTSQDVVEASSTLVVSSTGMRFTSGTDTWIGGGARAATWTGGEAATRPLAVRYATVHLQRVRAFMRVTRSAKGSACCPGTGAGGSASLTQPGRRCEPVAQLSDAGGPSPLTEDRQKTETRL
jgi:hypothetical protein